MMKPVLRWVDEREVLSLLSEEDLLLFNVGDVRRFPFICMVVGDSLDDVNLRVQCGWVYVDELDVFMIRNWELLRGGEGVFTEMAEGGVFEDVVEYTSQHEVEAWLNEILLETKGYMGVYALDTPLVNPITYGLSREISSGNPLMFIRTVGSGSQRSDVRIVKATKASHGYSDQIEVLLTGVDLDANKMVTVNLMSGEFHGFYTHAPRRVPILSEETPDGCYALRHDGEVVRLYRTSGYEFTTSSGDLYLDNGTYRSSWDEKTQRRYEKNNYGELNIKRVLGKL